MATLSYSCLHTPNTHTRARAQELYRKIAWPLYRIYGHAFEAMKTMVNDDGAAVFKRLEEENKGPMEVLTPEVRAHTYAAAQPSPLLCVCV